MARVSPTDLQHTLKITHDMNKIYVDNHRTTNNSSDAGNSMFIKVTRKKDVLPPESWTNAIKTQKFTKAEHGWMQSLRRKDIRKIPTRGVKPPAELDDTDDRLFRMNYVFGLDSEEDGIIKHGQQQHQQHQYDNSSAGDQEGEGDYPSQHSNRKRDYDPTAPRKHQRQQLLHETEEINIGVADADDEDHDHNDNTLDFSFRFPKRNKSHA